MPRNLARRNLWIGFAECPNHRLQRRILPIVVGSLVFSFELDANRKVIAAMLPAEAGIAGMPRPFRKWHKLDHTAVAANENMCGDLHAANLLEIRVCTPVQRVREQRFNLGATKFARRQADAVHNYHRRFRTVGPRIAVGAVTTRRRVQVPGSFVYGEKA